MRRGRRRPALLLPAARRRDAVEIARKHWRPDFLLELVAGMPADYHAEALLAAAAGGDAQAFRELLDANVDMGRKVEQERWMRKARKEGVFTERRR